MRPAVTALIVVLMLAFSATGLYLLLDGTAEASTSGGPWVNESRDPTSSMTGMHGAGADSVVTNNGAREEILCRRSKAPYVFVKVSVLAKADGRPVPGSTI